METVIKNRGTSCVGVRKTGTTLIHVSTVMGTLYIVESIFYMLIVIDKIGSCEVDMMFEDLDKFIAENPEEVLVTGGWTDDKISELEKQLSIVFREEVKIFIRKYGVLIGYGVEIAACGRNGHSRFVEDTLRFRKNGLKKKYIVIEGDGELAYCLNNETGEIVNWGLDNLEVYPEAESLESFVLAQFKEGKMNW